MTCALMERILLEEREPRRCKRYLGESLVRRRIVGSASKAATFAAIPEQRKSDSYEYMCMPIPATFMPFEHSKACPPVNSHSGFEAFTCQVRAEKEPGTTFRGNGALAGPSTWGRDAREYPAWRVLPSM